MRPVDASELLALGAYEEIRARFRARILEEKRRRRVALGANMTAVFENRDTVLFQIQEMLRTERITAPAAVQHEIDTYNTLVPGQDELCLTLFVEYTDKDERERMLVALAGMEERVTLSVDGERVRGQPEQRGERTDRTTAVHYFKFHLGSELAARVRDDAVVALEIDHPAYRAQAPLTGPTLESLRADLA